MATKTRKVIWIIGIIVVVLVALSTAGYLSLKPRPLKPPETVSSLAKLEAYLENLIGYNADSPPGVSVVVVKDGKIVYQNAFGMADGPKNISATIGTVYNTWSMVKPMTAAAVLQLQEQGLLDIDDPVADYLPFFEVQYPSEGSETVTIRHLMNHSSGLGNNVPELFKWIHFHGDPERNQTELIKEKLPDYAELTYEPGMGYVDILRMAMKREEQALQFYNDIAGKVEDEQFIKACKFLAQEEAKHKNILETIYDDHMAQMGD